MRQPPTLPPPALLERMPPSAAAFMEAMAIGDELTTSGKSSVEMTETPGEMPPPQRLTLIGV
jgi:hypothetical protein